MGGALFFSCFRVLPGDLFIRVNVYSHDFSGYSKASHLELLQWQAMAYRLTVVPNVFEKSVLF